MKMVEWFRSLSVAKKFAVFIVIVILGLVLADTASGQGQECAPERNILINAMKDEHGVTRQTMGVTHTGVVFEQWANDETGVWGLTATHPSGIMCVITHGDGFETAVALPTGEAM